MQLWHGPWAAFLHHLFARFIDMLTSYLLTLAFEWDDLVYRSSSGE
jgi:hypothetical protein